MAFYKALHLPLTFSFHIFGSILLEQFHCVYWQNTIYSAIHYVIIGALSFFSVLLYVSFVVVIVFNTHIHYFLLKIYVNFGT